MRKLNIKNKKAKIKVKKAGRPSGYSPDMAERAKELAECGYSDRVIYSRMGIERATFYNYLKQHKEFANAIEVGRARLVRGEVEPAFMRQAFEHDEVTELHELRGRGKKAKMKLVGKRVARDVVNIQAAERLMKSHMPEKYGDKLQIAGGAKISINITKTYRKDGNTA